MLADLSKYIIKRLSFENNSVGLLMKELLEHVPSDKIAKEVMMHFRNDIEAIVFEGIEILNDLFWDQHIQDICYSIRLPEQLLLNMMLMCFEIDYDYEVWINDADDYYTRYIANEQNVIYRWLEYHDTSFLSFFSCDEETFEDFYESLEFRAMHIVLDAEHPQYCTVVELLKGLSFVEIEEGLLMCGIAYDCCYGDEEPSLKWILDELIEELQHMPSKRALSTPDIRCLQLFDGEESNLYRALINAPRISRKEVIF